MTRHDLHLVPGWKVNNSAVVEEDGRFNEVGGVIK